MMLRSSSLWCVRELMLISVPDPGLALSRGEERVVGKRELYCATVAPPGRPLPSGRVGGLEFGECLKRAPEPIKSRVGGGHQRGILEQEEASS